MSPSDVPLWQLGLEDHDQLDCVQQQVRLADVVFIAHVPLCVCVCVCVACVWRVCGVCVKRVYVCVRVFVCVKRVACGVCLWRVSVSVSVSV
jgi:hypothetical protein